MTLAIDISNNNKTVDVAALKKAHHDLTVLGVKRGEGASYVDTYFDSNFRQGAAAGLVVLPYYFARPETQKGMGGGMAEASQFFAELNGHGYFTAKQCGKLVLDFETVPDNAFALAFAQRIRHLVGHYPIIYAPASHVPLIDADVTLRHLDLWVADYGGNYKTFTGDHKGRIVMWQYTDKLDGQYDASQVYVSPASLLLKQPIYEVFVDGVEKLAARPGAGRVRKMLASSAFLGLVSKYATVIVKRARR